MSFILSNGSRNSDFIRDHERFDPDHLLISDDYIQFSTQGDLRDGGRTCRLVYGVNNCADAEIRIRTSIYKVKEEDQVGFKPMIYPSTTCSLHVLKGVMKLVLMPNIFLSSQVNVNTYAPPHLALVKMALRLALPVQASSMRRSVLK